MDSFLTILTALVATIISLAIAVKQLIRSIHLKEEDLVFWACSIFFVILPIMFDLIVVSVGQTEEFNRLLNEQSPNYWTGADADIIFDAALFTFLFNGFFLITSIVIKHTIKITRIRDVSTDVYGFTGNIFLLILSAIPCVSLIVEGANFITSQSENIQLSLFTKYIGLLVPLGAVCAYRTFLCKKYFLMFLYVLPIFILSFISQARAIFFYIPSALLMAYLYKSNVHIPLKRLLAIGLTLLVMAQTVKIATNEHHGFWTRDDNILFTVVNMFRDTSIGDFYYSIYTQKSQSDTGTEGSSTLALILTGIVPPFLGNDIFDPHNTVTYRIYQLRFGNVDYGSMHPTLYGAAYFDLGYLGLILAMFIPIALRIYKSLLNKLNFADSIAPVMIANFYFVCMRGSINVAYFRLIYSGVFILLVMSLVYLFQYILDQKYARLFHLNQKK